MHASDPNSRDAPLLSIDPPLMMPLQEQPFRLFSLLPTEIRLDIWQYSCHQRVVEVYYNSKKDRCEASTPPPAILHVCRESRREALRLYKELFCTKTHSSNIYFNPEVDTLYIPRPSYLGYDNSSRDFAKNTTGASEVINLALDHVSPRIRKPWETYNKYVLMQSFPQVKEVYLVLDSDEEPYQVPTKQHHGFLKLAEPHGDRTSIGQILADIKTSFSYEVGADFDPCHQEEEDGKPKAPALVLKSKVATNYLRLL
ncbi:hypothetical protein BX600DRAFT_429392 [Xylariales sp. PMI_506]|nr:hypothetical protein BX600DRAFT_429392 [Xylariales sp. PMI_506]